MKIIHTTGLITFFCITLGIQAKGQVQIVEEALDKINAAKNISYTVSRISNDPFGGSDSRSKINASFFNHQADGSYEDYCIDDNSTYGKFRYMGNGNEQIELTFKDSTYSIKQVGADRSALSPLHNLVKDVRRYLNNKYKIQMLNDSVINKTSCYHVFFSLADSLDKSYVKHHLFISKVGNMILGSRSNMQAAASKGGVSLGIIKMYSELYFDNYKFNVTIPDSVLMQIPAGFKLEQNPKPLLSKGVIAPDWELTSTNGQTLSLASLKGKVILIDFTFNGCPACMLALPSLKKLHQKFDGANVAIVTINTSNSKEEVSKFIKNNNIKTPIYINGSQIAKSYHVQGGPIFYIINKQVEISEAYNGYFENFDTEIPAKIEALR